MYNTCNIVNFGGFWVDDDEQHQGEGEDGEGHDRQGDAKDQAPECKCMFKSMQFWISREEVPEGVVLASKAGDKVEGGQPQEQQPGAVPHLKPGWVLYGDVHEDEDGDVQEDVQEDVHEDEDGDVQENVHEGLNPPWRCSCWFRIKR